ncbi:MAG: nucleotidyltransferase family protein [Erythrobacter sp.]|nr:nucleotidyltransferase family protein [Erythrobacter sp.]
MTGTGQRARIGRALLALCGHRSAECAALSQEDWRDLDRLASEHRLRPFLHGRISRGEIEAIPDTIAAGWSNAHRANGITILAQRRALLQAASILADEGIDAIALKGSALAWTVWPGPAERVMRDIDVLVAEEQASRAYELLRNAGWSGPDFSVTALGLSARVMAHMPPLHSPEGVMCEIHGHIWGSAPLPGAPMPVGDNRSILERARHDDRLGAAIPEASDMLVHLVVHAACSHLLNVGPMALIDVDLWCAQNRIEWAAFWERAERERFDRPAALVFALVDRWRRPGFLAETSCQQAVAAEMLDRAEALLVQDLDARKDVSVIASMASGRLGGRIGQHPLDRAEDDSGILARTSQLAGRSLSLARSLLSPQTCRDGLATAKLQKWMEG